MTILEQYRKERRNYLRRVNRQVRQGYMVDVIPIPKKPTRASIRRLKNQTAKVIQQTSILVDMLTGEAYQTTTSKPGIKQRKIIHDQNKEFLKLSLQEQVMSQHAGRIQHIIHTDEILSKQESYELLIDNWYTAIEGFRPDIYQYLLSKTNELLEGASPETRRRFAYVYQQNPDIFPEAGDSDRRIINAKFDQIRNMMNWASDSEAYKDFISKFDEVEDE